MCGVHSEYECNFFFFFVVFFFPNSVIPETKYLEFWNWVFSESPAEKNVVLCVKMMCLKN